MSKADTLRIGTALSALASNIGYNMVGAGVVHLGDTVSWEPDNAGTAAALRDAFSLYHAIQQHQFSDEDTKLLEEAAASFSALPNELKIIAVMAASMAAADHDFAPVIEMSTDYRVVGIEPHDVEGGVKPATVFKGDIILEDADGNTTRIWGGSLCFIVARINGRTARDVAEERNPGISGQSTDNPAPTRLQ